MKLIEWDDSLLLGVEPVDSHHKHLVSLLGKAQNSFLWGIKQGEIEQILDELVAYANYHFAAEEELMLLNNFSGIGAHQEEHESFRRWVADLRRTHAPDDLEAYMEVTNVLIEWLVSHIKGIDSQCCSFLHQKAKEC